MSAPNLTPQGQKTVKQILELLKTTEFVPAISQILEIIQDLSSKNQNAQIQELVEAISKDLGLTSKIIIAANTVHFNHTGQRIHTITEAIHQVGLSEIRSLVVTLLFLSPLQDPLRSDEIRNVSSIALISGLIAQKVEILVPVESSEEILICSTLRHYGRLLITNFLSEEIGPLPEELDFQGIENFYHGKIGVTPLELGYHVASAMNLSSSILKSMEEFHENRIPSLIKDPDGIALIVSSFSMSLCQILEEDNINPEIIGERFKDLASKYAGVLKVDYKIIIELLEFVLQELGNFQTLYHLPPFQTDFIDRITCVNSGVGTTSLKSIHLKPTTSTDTFVLALQEITEMLTSEKTTSANIFQKIVRTVHEALRLRNCVILMREQKETTFHVNEAVGQNAFEFRTDFKINLEGKDLFSACLLRADDVLLQNLTEPKIHQHLLAWYKSISPAGTAFLLPIKDNDQMIGLIYGDKIDIGSISFTPDILRNLKALRNQIRIARKLFPSRH